jgi:hypothetical protein
LQKKAEIESIKLEDKLIRVKASNEGFMEAKRTAF